MKITQNTDLIKLSENYNQNLSKNEKMDQMKIFKYNKDLTGKFNITNKSLGKGTFLVIYFLYRF